MVSLQSHVVILISHIAGTYCFLGSIRMTVISREPVDFHCFTVIMCPMIVSLAVDT